MQKLLNSPKYKTAFSRYTNANNYMKQHLDEHVYQKDFHNRDTKTLLLKKYIHRQLEFFIFYSELCKR